MGFLDFLVGAATIVDAVSGFSDTRYNVECKTFELFEIGTTWRGTARVHGAGNHLETIKMNTSTTITKPHNSDAPRSLMRDELRNWAGKNFAYSGSISKDMIVINEGENCISIDGYVKKINGQWKLVNSPANATNFGSFKLYVSESNGKEIGYEELVYLFKEATTARISSVDVTDGF